jgi:hypothetical protein
VSKVGTIPLFFPESNPDFANVCSRHISSFFGRENICFLSSREDIWCVVAFNGVLIYFGSYLSYLFSRLPIISEFLLYWSNTLFCSHCTVNYGVFFYTTCIDHLYRLGEQQQSTFKGNIDQHFCFISIFFLNAAVYVRSADVIAVVGILFVCALMCYFGQDWWYFSQISRCIYWLSDFFSGNFQNTEVLIIVWTLVIVYKLEMYYIV